MQPTITREQPQAAKRQLVEQIAEQVIWGPETVQAELRPCKDRELNQDLVALCTRANAATPKLPGGRQLQLTLDPFPKPR